MIVPDWAGYLRFRDRFAGAMEPVFYPIEYLDSLILSGAARLWIGEQAAIVAELKNYPGGAKVVHGLVAAGRIEEIVGDLIPQAEEYGRQNGCTHAMIESTAGWQRVLKPHGYEPHQLTVVKEL